jgi:uncharacterized DUF497 family protein
MGITLFRDEEFRRWFAAWLGEFDWDEGNRRKPLKHGLDCTGVERLFDSFFVYAGCLAPPPDQNWAEPRHLVFLRDDVTALHWTAVVTPRGESLRVITCRRSRPMEEAIHEEACRREKDQG